MILRNVYRLLLTTLFLACLQACTTMHIPPDNKWRAVYGIHVPDEEVQLFVKTVDLEPATDAYTPPRRLVERTEIRLLRSKPFLNYAELPESTNAPLPATDGLPGSYTDTGPMDMSLIGSQRVVRVSTGVELLVRTSATNVGLQVIQQTNNEKERVQQ